jgi:hypothetical protein
LDTWFAKFWVLWKIKLKWNGFSPFHCWDFEMVSQLLTWNSKLKSTFVDVKELIK